MDCHILDPDIAPEINSKGERILNHTGKIRLVNLYMPSTGSRKTKLVIETASDNLRIDN